MSTFKNSKILLASASAIKKEAVKQYFKDWIVDCINCDAVGLPPQPVNCGMECAYQRVCFAKLQRPDQSYDLVIAIESDVVIKDGSYFDRVHVRIEAGDIVGVGKSDDIMFPLASAEACASQPIVSFILSDKIKGYATTIGEYLHKETGCDAKNWMWDLKEINRTDQILTGIAEAYDDLTKNIASCSSIRSCYVSYPDYPKAGVLFKAFYSLFKGNNMNKLGEILESKYAAYEIDVILPLESRGLVLGAMLADRLKCAMVPLQKPGKIPGALITMAYEKEYGSDDIQISLDLFGSIFSQLSSRNTKIYRFLVVDDLIATGGTIEAAVKILRLLSKLYAFRYEVFILSLDEVPPLRCVAEKKIGKDYCILFRDAVNKNTVDKNTVDKNTVDENAINEAPPCVLSGAIDLLLLDEFEEMCQLETWDRRRLRKILKKLLKSHGSARCFGDMLHAMKDEPYPNFPSKPLDPSSPFFDGFRSYRMRVDDIANRELGSMLPNPDKRKCAYILAARPDEPIYCDDDSDMAAFDEAHSKCNGRAITLWRFNQ